MTTQNVMYHTLPTLYTFKELVQELESEREAAAPAMGYMGIENERFVDYAFEPAHCAHAEEQYIRQTRQSQCNDAAQAAAQAAAQSQSQCDPRPRPPPLLLPSKRSQLAPSDAGTNLKKAKRSSPAGEGAGEGAAPSAGGTATST